jgi:hypothetical protein
MRARMNSAFDITGLDFGSADTGDERRWRRAQGRDDEGSTGLVRRSRR